MPISTIVCKHCSEILRKGDPGGQPEYKLCPQCVIKTHKHSEGVVGTALKAQRQQSTTNDGRTRFAVENELEQLKKRISKLNIELPYRKVNDDYHLIIQIQDAHNRPFAEFGFPASKLREIADDLDMLKKQEAK